MRWTGHVVRLEIKGGASRILEGRSDEKSMLGKPRRRWKDYTKSYL
jgi:hypothetical protein